MDEFFTVKIILPAVFLFGGILMILLGVFLWRKLWGNNSVEIDAECIDIHVHTEVLGTGMDRTYFHNAKRPVYRYSYEGQQYIASPLLTSNRSGYKPERGRCRIRINPKHPEKVYSPERKFVGLILIGIGTMWIAVAVLAVLLLLFLGI